MPAALHKWKSSTMRDLWVIIDLGQCAFSLIKKSFISLLCFTDINSSSRNHLHILLLLTAFNSYFTVM